jgi:dihydrofolate synthase/folylpolyglutamate synthase
MENDAFRESLSFLYGLERFGMVFGLANIRNIVQVLGNPHQNLKTIHIAGSNGKGSTAAMIASVLQKSGYRVGLYTSPHILSFTERIQINSESIAERQVARLTERIRGAIDEARIPQEFTFFDFTTAMAFLYFAESGVDLAIVEVGLGGRLDSTNIVMPLVAVVTNISYEHRDVLGYTLSEIAMEKAGIIKQGVPVVTGVTEQEIQGELEGVCRKQEAALYRMGRDFTIESEDGGSLHFRGRRWDLAELRVNLMGKFQIDNAGVALATLETVDELGYTVSRKCIYDALERITWPGRLEVVRERPWVVLDGAHNPAAAEALRTALLENFPYRRCFLLLGIMKDKEVETIVSILAPLSHETVLCKPRQDRAAPPERLVRALEAVGGKGQVIPDVAEGLDTLLSRAGENDLICVAGSFYTIGEAKAHLMKG